ncbi:DNA-binding NarL/FixJ family response regulator [Dyadobacter jejuensis]|uniref:DNA-binding NarL/FixJ family response regulator n=1 Tax=Dyadobacter jejuensis TaxID=1082580 RepID=A0A316ASI4_9BACT|nr:response regulator transcription factor [Dyadobacter jejuensis]PWJ60478.1 DNA-binding NarL/FixJ family response regulator [Dyadobacter jejuensis]
MDIKIAIVDDHELMAKALSGLVQRFDGYDVIFEVSSGSTLIQRLELGMLPDILLLDINMPDMDGFEIASWLQIHYPQIKILALSMNDKETAIVKMLQNGARGYLLKGCKPQELKQALESLVKKGFYYTDYVTSQLIKSLNPDVNNPPEAQYALNDREKRFVELSCSELTYTEIADKMCVSPRTVDGYRESVFQKMNVKSRVGMVLEAIKANLVKLEAS